MFNRGIKGSSRQAIAAELAGLLGVSEPVPQIFDGIPVLNNQKSWFFPYAKDREPDHIDKLWQVFALGLQLADAEDEQPQGPFRAAFDAAMELYDVAWNLTFGLYWCRPWSFLSLDGNSRGYLADKLRLPLSWHGPKNRCSASDLLQLITTLRQRFEEPDFPVHSFPELSLEAWTYTGPTSARPASHRHQPGLRHHHPPRRRFPATGGGGLTPVDAGAGWRKPQDPPEPVQQREWESLLAPGHARPPALQECG